MKNWMNVTLFAIVSLPACVSDDDIALHPSHDVGVSTQAITPLDGEFSWSQGQAPVPMGSSADRFCFLTAISGKFAGSGESVSAAIIGEGGPGAAWVLGGTSEQRDVSASAKCVPLSSNDRFYSYSEQFKWKQQDTSATILGSDSDRTCFLTSVTGHFQGASERVQITQVAGNWQLDGASKQLDVGASARCLISGEPAGTFTWSQNQQPVLMFPVSMFACGFTRMTGNFQGKGESLRITQGGGSWFLLGTSGQSGVAASAVCAL